LEASASKTKNPKTRKTIEKPKTNRDPPEKKKVAGNTPKKRGRKPKAIALSKLDKEPAKEIPPPVKNLVPHDVLYARVLVNTKKAVVSKNELVRKVGISISQDNSFTWNGNKQLSKNSLDYLNDVFSMVFPADPIEVVAMPVVISVGDKIIKQLFGKDETFYVRISMRAGTITPPQGFSPQQKELFTLSQLNSRIPKETKGIFGFVSFS
jgi:hypothetical protein